MNEYDVTDFLPVSKADMESRGWWWYDFLIVTGDAYVDHPSFGPTVIARVLEAEASGWPFWPSRTGTPVRIFWPWGGRSWVS